MLGNDVLRLGGFNGWRCDHCGWLISAIQEGSAEWLASRLSLFRHRWVTDSKTHGRSLCSRAITSLCAQIDSVANSHAEPLIAAGRGPQTMGLNLWPNVTL